VTEQPTSIFRREALEFRAGVRQDRAVLHLGGTWSALQYWLVLLLGIVGAIIGWTVRAEATTSGPAFLDSRAGTFTALLPVAVGPDLKAGQPVRLRLTDPTGRTVSARTASVEVADSDQVRRAGFTSVTGPAVLVSGLVSADGAGAFPAAGQPEAEAVIVLRSEWLIDLLFDGVGALFRKGGDG
jgi:hypothetical protein